MSTPIDGKPVAKILVIVIAVSVIVSAAFVWM